MENDNNTNTQTAQQNTAPQQNTQTPQQPSIDYDKLASIINGKQQVTEQTVLKSYLKEQGLNDTELKEAINHYKEEKQKRTPDVGAMQNEINSYKQQIAEAKLQQAATSAALEIGVDPKRMNYVIKLADLSKVAKEDGTIDADAVKSALNQVLKDVPELMGASNNTAGNAGFHVGGNANNPAGAADNQQILENIFGIRRK